MKIERKELVVDHKIRHKSGTQNIPGVKKTRSLLPQTVNNSKHDFSTT